MAKHSDLTPALGIHVPYAWSYADATAREAASGLVSGDMGKLARQEDDNSLWMLTATTPTWLEVGGSGSVPAHASTHKGGGSDAIDVATSSLSGLLSAADKAKLDLLGAGDLRIPVRNESGAQLDKGTLVAGVGWNVANDCSLIDVADKDDPDARPAIGVLEENIANNANGAVLVAGQLNGVDTSAWELTDQLVLGSAGAFSRPPPDVDPFTGEVQNMGVVVRDDASDGVVHLLPDGMNAVTATNVFALAGSSGTPSKTNPYVTDADARLKDPTRTFLVADQGGDYTSIKSAVDAAVALGDVTQNDPFHILVAPGLYSEAPMTIIQGLFVTSLSADMNGRPIVTASNAAEDLFTCQGGGISGLILQGVSDSAKALVKLATASTVTVLNCCGIRDCSTGVDVSNGAAGILINFSVELQAVGQAVTTGISCSGSGTYLAANGLFFSAVAALLPGYTGNPIQTAIRIASSAKAFVVAGSFECAPKDSTQDVILIDGGAELTLLACEIKNSGTAIHVGSSGSNTQCVVQGGNWSGNTLNGKCDSATGAIMVSASADSFKWDAVSGAVLSGIVQLSADDTSYLVGLLNYYFLTGKTLELNDWFHDQSSTGVSYIDGVVEEDSGLDVSVPAGHGYVTRHDPNHDTFSVSWDADTVTCNASSVNYICYDSTTDALVTVSSEPGTTYIILAIVYTASSSIRFVHQCLSFVHDSKKILNDYLLQTRKIFLKSGLAATAGTGGRKFQVDSGYYYRALDTIEFAGTGGDATWSAFYGSDGVSEVSTVTQIDNSQYDSSGTLTNLTSGYFRTDTLYLTSDGRLSLVYGREEHASQELAEAASADGEPSFVEPSAICIALLVVEEGGDIEAIVDQRPTGESSGGSGGTVTVHADLSGLSADDHSQYLLTSGSRAMSGDLNMGSNDISSVGTVDGVDVSDHSARHIPGGADALTLGTPVATQVGATAAEGTAASFARSDHQHGVGAGTPVAVGTANATGSSSNVARADHVHSGLKRDANDFSVFSNKVAPVGADILLIEDSADSGNKKRISMSVLPAGVDSTAIHKATDAEISAMTAKTSPVDADILVLEDSSDGYSKKKVTLANVLAAASVFGQQAQNGESLSSSTTTSSWIQKLRVTTSSLPSGLYRIGWSCELRMQTTVSYDAKVRVQINDTTTLAEGIVECKDTNSYYPFGGFGYHTGSGVLNLDMDFGSESASHTAEIRNARIEIWRIS